VDIPLGFKKNREMTNVSDLRLVRTLLFLPASNRARSRKRGTSPPT
jgi:hypothetical protein